LRPGSHPMSVAGISVDPCLFSDEAEFSLWGNTLIKFCLRDGGYPDFGSDLRFDIDKSAAGREMVGIYQKDLRPWAFGIRGLFYNQGILGVSLEVN